MKKRIIKIIENGGPQMAGMLKKREKETVEGEEWLMNEVSVSRLREGSKKKLRGSDKLR